MSRRAVRKSVRRNRSGINKYQGAKNKIWPVCSGVKSGAAAGKSRLKSWRRDKFRVARRGGRMIGGVRLGNDEIINKHPKGSQVRAYLKDCDLKLHRGNVAAARNWMEGTGSRGTERSRAAH